MVNILDSAQIPCSKPKQSSRETRAEKGRAHWYRKNCSIKKSAFKYIKNTAMPWPRLCKLNSNTRIFSRFSFKIDTSDRFATLAVLENFANSRIFNICVLPILFVTCFIKQMHTYNLYLNTIKTTNTTITILLQY